MGLEQLRKSTIKDIPLLKPPDKGYVVVGSSNTTITNGIFLIKLDPVGKMTWTQLFKKGEYYFGDHFGSNT